MSLCAALLVCMVSPRASSLYAWTHLWEISVGRGPGRSHSLFPEFSLSWLGRWNTVVSGGADWIWQSFTGLGFCHLTLSPPPPISFRLCRKKKSFLARRFMSQIILSEVSRLLFLLGRPLMRWQYYRNFTSCDAATCPLRKVLAPPEWILHSYS